MIEPLSSTWLAVEKRCNDEIETSRKILEQPGLPDGDAQLHRGRILMARSILRLHDQKIRHEVPAKPVPLAGY